MTTHGGGCLCGAVRYTVTADALAVRECWCRLCQYIGAGSSTVNAFFPTDQVVITGELRRTRQVADSGGEMERAFCPACGVHVTTSALSRPHLTGLRVGTLDDPARFPPQATIWTSAAPDWACMNPDLPRVDRQPAPAK